MSRGRKQPSPAAPSPQQAHRQPAFELRYTPDAAADIKALDGSVRNQLRKVLEKKRSEEHTSELQSRLHLVCRLLLEKKKNKSVHPRPQKPPPCRARLAGHVSSAFFQARVDWEIDTTLRLSCARRPRQ